MIVEINLSDARWADVGLQGLAQTAFDAVSSHLSLGDDCAVSVLACGDAEIADLNGQFRDKPTPTNVLSWPSEDLAADCPGNVPYHYEDPELGDIAIAFDTCQREAEAFQITLADHTTHLCVHGLLHLLGYDHINDADAQLMEKTEVLILEKLGVKDPYGRN